MGILAGDHLKQCSYLGVLVVAVGLIYSQGYVRQRIRDDGWHEDLEENLERTYDPIAPVLDEHGDQLTVQMPIFDPPPGSRSGKSRWAGFAVLDGSRSGE